MTAPNAVYIAAAYLGTALVTAGLIAWTALAATRQKARLKALQAAGVRRRSDKRA